MGWGVSYSGGREFHILIAKGKKENLSMLVISCSMVFIECKDYIHGFESF